MLIQLERVSIAASSAGRKAVDEGKQIKSKSCQVSKETEPSNDDRWRIPLTLSSTGSVPARAFRPATNSAHNSSH